MKVPCRFTFYSILRANIEKGLVRSFTPTENWDLQKMPILEAKTSRIADGIYFEDFRIDTNKS